MRKLILAAALIAATPAFAGDLAVDMYLGTTMPEVEEHLTGMGYQIRKSEMEDGKIEIYFVEGKNMGEVYVSPATGRVTKLEMK